MGCGPGHVARYLRDAGASVFGLDLSPGMLEQARKLNPDIPFREGNMLELDIRDGALAGIAAFYAIVNIPKRSLPAVFREMQRVLQPGGLLLLAFHTGNEVLHEDELWGQKISMDFLLFHPQKSSSNSRPRASPSKTSSNANPIPTSSTRAEGHTSLPGSRDSGSDRDQLKRGITLHQRGESLNRRPRCHRKISLHLTLETIQISLQYLRLVRIRNRPQPKPMLVLPFFSVTSPAASALRTHCVRPRGATRNRLPPSSSRSIGVE